MITENPKISVWNQAEELVGTYPSADGLRNAIHAVITGCYACDPTRLILENVEYLAREYEVARGTHQHLGVMGQPIDCSYAMQYDYASGCDNSYIWNSNRSI